MGTPTIQFDFKLNLFYDEFKPYLDPIDFNVHTFWTTRQVNMPVPAYVEPSSNLSKVGKVARATFLYLFDLQLFLWILPRGVKMTIRLASMIFLKLGLISSTAYVNFALVSTIKADRGMIEPNTLTMSTGRILGVPDKDCSNSRQKRSTGWDKMIEKMAMDQPTAQKTLAEKTSSMDEEQMINSIFDPNTSKTQGVKEEFSNATTTLPEDFSDVIFNNGTLPEDFSDVIFNNGTFLTNFTGPSDQNLVDTVVEVLLEYFDLQLSEADLDYTYDDQDEFEADFLSDRLAQKVSSKTMDKTKGSKRRRGCKILSKTDLKIIMASMAALSFFLAGMLSCLICRDCAKKQVTSRGQEEMEMRQQQQEQISNL